MNMSHALQKIAMSVLLLGLIARPAQIVCGEEPTTGPNRIEPEKRYDALERIKSKSLRLGGTATASGAMAALYKQFLKTHPDAPGGIWYTSGGNGDGIRQLVKGDVEAGETRDRETRKPGTVTMFSSPLPVLSEFPVGVRQG